MSLLDRQGFFYAVVGLVVLLFRDMTMRRRVSETFAASSGVAATVVYAVILGPLIVLYLNRYRPTLAARGKSSDGIRGPQRV